MQNFIFMKNEWQLLPHSTTQTQFKHRHSSDQCQIVFLRDLNMRNIDQYTSRQFYSHPFCPKVYKTALGSPKSQNNELLFDFWFIVESVPLRLGHCDCKIEDGKIADIIKGFIYLSQRYGFFKLTEKMIGSTKEGVTKVWYNQDFSCNKVSQKLMSQKEMTELLLAILKKHNLIDKNKVITCQDLTGMLNSLRRKTKNSKQVNFQEMRRIHEEGQSKERDAFKEIKSSHNQEKHSLEKKIKRCQTFCRKQTQNINPFDSSQSAEKSQKKQKTLVSHHTSGNFIRQSLNFTKNSIPKRGSAQRPKSETGAGFKKTQKMMSTTLNDYQSTKNLKQQANFNLYQTNFQKSLTNFAVFTRKAQKQTSSQQSDQQSSVHSLGKRQMKSNFAFLSPRFNSRHKSQHIKHKTQKEMKKCQIEEQVKALPTVKSLNGVLNTPKSLQQALQQDVDALFLSNKLLPQAVDNQKLGAQLDALLQML